MLTLKDRLRDINARYEPTPTPADASAFFPFVTWDEKWKQLSRDAWARNAGCCFYCGRYADPVKVQRTLDHVIPKCKRGIDAEWNLVPACKSCNASKGKSWASEWCSRWLSYRLIRHHGFSTADAIQRREAVIAKVIEIEAYHQYLQEVKRNQCSR